MQRSRAYGAECQRLGFSIVDMGDRLARFASGLTQAPDRVSA